MSDPLISVLIPAYNRADTIVRCINSAQASRYERLEIIVSDNGSTDGTADMVAGLAETDPRIELIRHRTNQGPLPNWKACLDRASGDLIHWLWSDDWIEPCFYATLIDGMKKKRAMVGFSAVRVVSQAEGWSYITHSFPPLDREKALKEGLNGRVFPVSPAAALLPIASVRRYFHDNIPVRNGLDCNRRAIGCDALMILGCIHDAETVFNHPEPLVNFSSHAGSITVGTDHDLLLAHYAWARVWWARTVGLPRRHCLSDLLFLLKNRRYLSAISGLLFRSPRKSHAC